MSPQLIIFDFDGTLADTTKTILWTYRNAINEVGLDRRSDEECRATIGLPLKEGFRHLYPQLMDEKLDKCVEIYRRIYTDNKDILIPALYPGVKESLSVMHASGLEMSIASSRSRLSLIEFCEASEIISFFRLILGADDVTRAKPDPEPVLKTLHTLGVDADQTIVVGDMPVDIAMGRGAGCCTVGVSYGNSSKEALVEAKASIVIDSFPELIRYING